MALKLRAHVTEGIPRTREISYQWVKNSMAMRKIMMAVIPTAVPKDERQSVVCFLTLENVLGSEIYARMCVVYGA